MDYTQYSLNGDDQPIFMLPLNSFCRIALQYLPAEGGLILAARRVRCSDSLEFAFFFQEVVP